MTTLACFSFRITNIVQNLTRREKVFACKIAFIKGISSVIDYPSFHIECTAQTRKKKINKNITDLQTTRKNNHLKSMPILLSLPI